MTTSQEQSKILPPTSDEPIPAWQVEYMCARLRGILYDRVLQTFDAQASAGTITRAGLAKRLDKRPEQITRWLASPNNWTTDTIAMLLFGMGAELDPRVTAIQQQAISYSHPLAAKIDPALAHSPQPAPVVNVDSAAEKSFTVVPLPLMRASPSKAVEKVAA